MTTIPDGYRPLNYCRVCSTDFTSLDAFDKHIVGPHDGDRRHVPPADRGLVLKDTVLGVPRYALPMTDDQKERLDALRAKAAA